VRELAFRGRFAAAYEALGTNIGPVEADSFGLLATLGAVPGDTVAAVFARLLHDRSIWMAAALPWWAARRDTTSLVAAMARADGELAHATSVLARRDWAYRAAAVRAYLSLARNSSDALVRFNQLADTLCMACYLDRLTKARLLDSLGSYAAAEHLLSERLHTLLSPVEVAMANDRARVAEKVQHYDAAARAYEFVAKAWSPGDDVPRSRASQAVVKAEQLAGDQPQRAKLTPAR
jgi:hypothetical protein